ncbi:hypothetical protein [Natrinema salifodinae]|uniref:Histidine kinase n=1 Tax=Natrinema salifodinae TaxID=1202768 RepID=A0A1I0NBU8_9EURY|nr:hypothetical protein [Natrinema salifodinae]SEV98478.1 hypothetical protein SAMN05216285_1532 [Natrinema salifodinae]
MSSDSNTVAAFGLRGSTGWIVGSVLGGALGAIAFGILMWLLDPEILAGAIPAIYGLEPTTAVGWAVHIAHGIVLGVAFGMLVTRDPILGVLRTDVATDVLARAGVVARLIGAGFVFGLAVWAILPLLVLPVWVNAVGGSGAAAFPTAAAGSLLGHLLFGVVLGVVFAATVDLRDRPTDATL